MPPHLCGMANSIYEKYIQQGRNSFLLSLVNRGDRNSWLLSKIKAELETVASPANQPAAKAVLNSQPQSAGNAKNHEAPPAKTNPFNLSPELQVLYNQAVRIYRETAALHAELAIDIYQQANLIKEDKRGEMISRIVEDRQKAIKIFERCREYEKTGIDPETDAKPGLDETNPVKVLKKIQSLRSSISRFKRVKNDKKLKSAMNELERLEAVYKTLTDV